MINYVFDGQHTIEAVALVSNSRETPVWCMIYDHLCYEHEAHIFAEQQKHHRSVAPYDTFNAHLESGSEKHLLIRDLVLSYNLELGSTQKRHGTICAIAALENIFDTYGYHVLDKALLLIALLLRKRRINAGQLFTLIEHNVLKSEKNVGVLYRLADLRIGQHTLLLKAPVSLHARRIIHVPAALVLIADMIGFQPLLPKNSVLRIDEMAVRAHDQRNAVLTIQLQEKLVDLPLLFCIVILQLQHEAVAEVLGEAENQLFCFLFAVLEHAGDAGGGHENIFGIEGQQQFHVHAGTVVKAADIRLRQSKVQIAHALGSFGCQNDVAVGVVLLMPVLDEIGFGNIAPAQAVLFRQQCAFAIVSLIAVLAGGKNAVPKLYCTAGVVIVGHHAVCQHDVADAGMPVVADVGNLKILRCAR